MGFYLKNSKLYYLLHISIFLQKSILYFDDRKEQAASKFNIIENVVAIFKILLFFIFIRFLIANNLFKNDIF